MTVLKCVCLAIALRHSFIPCAAEKKTGRFPLHASEVELEISRPRMTVLK